MARLMECSRCGAGINPNDTQCWRCGESVKAAPKPAAPVRPMSGKIGTGGGIKDVGDIKPRENRPAPTVKPIAPEYSTREKGLQDREQELREEMEALEAESHELEMAAQEIEKERLALDEARARIKAREDDLDAMAIVVQSALQAAEDHHKGVKVGDKGKEQMDRLFRANRDLKPVLEEERQRIRQAIEREMADQLSRIGQLEAELKAAYEQMRSEEHEEPASSVDVRQVIAAVTAQLRGQIGAGLPSGLDDRKVLTHVERLDQILSGGIPAGSVVLVNGPAGSMKTSLAYHFLHNLASKEKVKGMFLSLEQDRESLIRQMQRLGMKREDSLDNLMVVDLVDLRRSMEGQHGDWRSIIQRYVENVMAENPFKVFVLDSLESFTAMSQHEYTRVEVQELFDWFRDRGLTTFVISETPMSRLERDDHMELYVADGALELTMKEVGDSHIQRWIRCVKMRGANIDHRYFTLMHAGGSFILSMPMMRASSSQSREE